MNLLDAIVLVGLSPVLVPVIVGKIVVRKIATLTSKSKYGHLPTVKGDFPASNIRTPGYMLKLVEEMRDKDGKIPSVFYFGSHIDGSHIVGVAGADGMRDIFTNDRQFPKFAPLYDVFDCVLGQGLVSIQGEKWHSERKLLTPLFHFDRLTHGVPKITSVCQRKWDELISKAKEDGEGRALDSVEITKVLSDITLSVIVKYAFGDEVPFSKVKGAFDGILGQFTAYMVMHLFLGKFARYLPLSPQREIARQHNIVADLIKEKVKKSLAVKASGKELKKEGEECTLLDTIIEQATGEDDKDTIDRAVSEGLTFLLAGEDTTSNTLGFTIDFLTRPENVHYQQKVREEALAVFGSAAGFNTATRDKVNELHFCEMVISETLRLAPPAPLVDRVTHTDTVIAGHRIPAGTAVLPFFLLLHRNARYWDEPDKFKPERFGADTKIENFSYSPFSAGRRNCIGQKLAMIEAKLILASLLLNFKLEAVAGPPQYGFLGVMTPLNFKVKMTPIVE
uniref:Cytochrome P450 n=1 Tax=Palpitomonas bilix TaxID=652834 RepID=A0A7S3D1L9_9EUKA|mmetsp:Transcript_18384/g.46123  ORF Transcript_18384/g.46123 Transcript_18384/m.46123 type:complete len:507 (+) Transcript_18384:77-1597(+)